VEQPGAPLAHGDDVTEHTPALGGKLHILVVAAEKPFFVGQLEQDLVQKQVHDGSIILMHDGYQTSVDAALKIADLFTEKGYVFVTADQLLLT